MEQAISMTPFDSYMLNKVRRGWSNLATWGLMDKPSMASARVNFPLFAKSGKCYTIGMGGKDVVKMVSVWPIRIQAAPQVADRERLHDGCSH